MMKTATILLLALTVTLGIQRSAEAQVAQRQQRQNHAAGGNANQAQPFAAQFQTGQLAQLMIANFDRDGDGMLNAVELQAALTAFLVRLSANGRFFQMQQMGNQGVQQQPVGFQGGVPQGFGRGPMPAFRDRGGNQQALDFQRRRGFAGGGRGSRARGQ
jgi:hypothetical protein